MYMKDQGAIVQLSKCEGMAIMITLALRWFVQRHPGMYRLMTEWHSAIMSLTTN